MRLFAVVAYPTLEAADREWLESIRRRHDPQASRLPAHFTLVFPAELERSDVEAEAAAAARVTPLIHFVIRGAKAARDAFGPGGHVFLVPAEGAAEIVALHDQLYGGALRPHWRQDIPYEPHITVAADADVNRCETIAKDLNRECQIVTGTLEHVEILDLSDSTIVSAQRFRLSNTQDRPPSL